MDAAHWERFEKHLSSLSPQEFKRLLGIGLKLAGVEPKPSNVVPFPKKAKASPASKR